MVSCFVCGASSLPQDEEDDQQYETPTRSAGSSPRKSRSNKNPYSSRGLDKFSALLAEIEDKRQQIYTKVDPDNIAFICFTHVSGDHDFKPIVIVKSSKPNSTDHQTVVKQQSPPLSRRLPSSSSMVVVDKTTTIIAKEFVEKKKGLYQLKECPELYLPIMIIFVLVIMGVFGRSFAIVCTSVGWYIIPTLKSNANCKTSWKKNCVIPRLSKKKKLVNVESFEGV